MIQREVSNVHSRGSMVHVAYKHCRLVRLPHVATLCVVLYCRSHQSAQLTQTRQAGQQLTAVSTPQCNCESAKAPTGSEAGSSPLLNW